MYLRPSPSPHSFIANSNRCQASEDVRLRLNVSNTNLENPESPHRCISCINQDSRFQLQFYSLFFVTQTTNSSSNILSYHIRFLLSPSGILCSPILSITTATLALIPDRITVAVPTSSSFRKSNSTFTAHVAFLYTTCTRTLRSFAAMSSACHSTSTIHSRSTNYAIRLKAPTSLLRPNRAATIQPHRASHMQNSNSSELFHALTSLQHSENIRYTAMFHVDLRRYQEHHKSHIPTTTHS